MHNKKISILISNFNKEKFLDECILSCLNQKYDNLEIIIIDNSSTDDSLNLINKYKDKLTIKIKKKVGKSSAENQIDCLIEAYKISSGDFILLLDSDDYFMPTKVTDIQNIFLNDKSIDILFDIPNILVDYIFKPLKIKTKNNKQIWPSTIPTSGISFRRNFFEKCLNSQLFNNYPTLEIDFRINFFAQKILKNFMIIEKQLTFYRTVNDGIMSKLKKFSNNWWSKRLQAHYFIQNIYIMNKISYKKNYD